jgi:glycerol-3-phosphate cytidylyltransferase
MNKKRCKSIIGYTTGVFDMFHIGHLHLLKKAKNNCDYLIVGVSTDNLVKSYKNKTPVIPFDHRVEIISSLKFVDEVVTVSHRNKKKTFIEVCYDVLFVGDDWKNSPIFKELEEYLNEMDAKIIYFPYTKNVSSSKFSELLTEISSTGIE